MAPAHNGNAAAAAAAAAPTAAARPKNRRKSFGIFTRPTVPNDSIDSWEDDSATPLTSVKTRPKSMFGGINGFAEVSTVVSSIPSTRKILTRTPRPRSIFGSLKGTDSGSSPTVTSSNSSSVEEHSLTEAYPAFAVNTMVVHAGEVVTGGGLLRKKKEYMVLTNRELLKYKSEAKANEAFGLVIKYPHARTSSVVSIGGEHLSSEHSLITTMDQVLAVHIPGAESEAGCVVQVDYLDGSYGPPSSTTIMASSRADAQVWVDRLRAVSAQARLACPPPAYTDANVEHIARRLEAEKDYSPMHFRVFRVVRSGKPGNKSSEDLQKLYSTMCYLAIGIHKIHIVPLAPVKGTSMHSPTVASSFGILNLTRLWIAKTDDCFSLTFR